jgi:thiamine pyrophosphate-dependent acetolactate synthase large subunit-like protein
MINRNTENRENGLAERLAKLSPVKRELFRQQLATQRLSGSDLVARSLRECGITHIYGVAGQPTEVVLPACSANNIRPIGVYHQTSAICMALAHNYQAGGLEAVALISAGPAVSNAITGLLVARDNGWPVIVLGGRRSSFQKFDALPIVSPVTKHVVAVPSTACLREHIHESYRIAVSGRPGPVYLELHEDVLAGHAFPTPPGPVSASQAVQPDPAVSAADIERIADALLSARRPAMLLGKGVRWTVSTDRLRKLIETLGLPVITSPMGRGFIAEDHPLCCNQARTVLQSQADVVLVLGARLNWMFRNGAELSRNATIFRVDIHPDEDTTAVPTEFIQADAAGFINRLLQQLGSRQEDVAAHTRRQHIDAWHNTLRMASATTQRLLEQRLQDQAQPMSPYRMMKAVRDALPDDVICITEGNISMRVAQAVIPALRPASRMDAGSNACMGVGIPFAIGAKLARPDRPVVVITGDYGFSLSAMELEVCMRHAIPIVVVVANNQGNNGATKQRALFPGDDAERVTMFQPGLEYDRVMTMFGGKGTTVGDPDILKITLQDAIASRSACCINVLIDPDTPLPNAWGEQGKGMGTR